MFEFGLAEETAPAGALRDEDWFDPAWLDEVPGPDGLPEPQPSASACAPSGWLALELEQSTADPARLSDTELIDTIVGFDRIASWASARQAALLAEFARRRPADDSQPTRSDVPSRCSEFAPDEIALALRLSRSTAANRVTMAQVLVADLPATLGAWQAGTIDILKTRAITETSYLLPADQRAALEARVLSRAGTQTLSQLRAALTRAVLVLDPDGAAARHEQRRADRRVVLGADGDGMATLWALLSAPDATAAYQRLCQLARSLGADDPRGMDARRADLLIDLLTGRRCAATATLLDTEDCADTEDCDHPDGPHGCDCAPTPGQTPTADDAPTACSGMTGSIGAGPGKPLISVVVPLSTLLGLDEYPGELVGYGPIPAQLAREIAADGTWRRLLTDPASGTLLDYGRTTYTPPAGLADFVRARDLYCRNPICGQRAATADLDHTMAWDDGGHTSDQNLYAGCRHDHRLKTLSPGWQVDQHPDGRVTWTTPTGHSYTSHPYDYRPDPHPPPAAAAPGTGAHSGTGGVQNPTTYDPDSDPPPF